MWFTILPLSLRARLNGSSFLKISYFILLSLVISCSSSEVEENPKLAKEKTDFMSTYKGYEETSEEVVEDATTPLVKPSIILSDSLSKLPEAPFLIRGCQGECCGILKSNVIKESIVLYKLPFHSSTVVGEIKKGELAKSIKHYVKVNKSAKWTYQQLPVDVLFYVSEGSYLFFNGSKIIVDMIDGSPELDVEEWVEVKGESISGWTSYPGDAMDPESHFDLRWCG